MSNRFLCIHGHFYQPPRENPWLEAIERQDSARPYHDWNERITAECYEPNAVARILNRQGRIVRLLNNYSRISFNFGPTLLAWLEGRAPATYAAILAADGQSVMRFGGHGSAIAQPYNHMILPLATPRDRRTQVAWGVRDFERRFGRRPEGMWLPETAVDLDTLEALAERGILFTILAPHQATRMRPMGEGSWKRVGGGELDTMRPYTQSLPSGRAIRLLFYDASLSTAVAFERLLDDGERFADRLLGAFDGTAGETRLLHLAADGETYGHHHRHGEMALAYALRRLGEEPGLRLTNYSEFLAAHPPAYEVEIAENTSWSCGHGIQRWREDCGCCTGAHPGWSQAWRAPLRAALDWLRDSLCGPFEEGAGSLLQDAWAARDAYIDVVLDRSDEGLERFFSEHGRAPSTPAERTAALKLLELQRHAMLMYTSCGWFFDDLGGIESIQVLRYAARAIQLADELFGTRLESGFLERLSDARSNDPELGDGRRIYELRVRPAMLDLRSVAAHHGAGSLFGGFGPRLTGEAFHVERSERRSARIAGARLETGRLRVMSRVTREEESFRFAALYHGGHQLTGGLVDVGDSEAFRRLVDDLEEALERGDLATAVRRLEAGFPLQPFSLATLLPDAQRFIVTRILEAHLARDAAIYRRVYEEDAPLMRIVTALGVSLPRAFRLAAEFVLNTELRRALHGDASDPDRAAALLAEARDAGIALDEAELAFALRRTLEDLAGRLTGDPSDLLWLDRLLAYLEVEEALPFPVEVWRVQNRLYRLAETRFSEARRLAEGGDKEAARWVERITRLAERLGLAID
ncbi:MAG: DUF3536 domain-containing protein [Gemmatimonadota bacterium]